MSLAVYNKLLSDLAERCNVKDSRVLRKSKELLSLLNTKHSLSYSETCKAVVCLELAANLISVDFNREDAIRLSGCSKRNYTNNFNNISKLLNLDKVYTVKEICLLVGASQAYDSSSDLLKKYHQICKLDSSTLDHPMYSCAAVFAVCHQEHIPLNQAKLVEISRVKKLHLSKLSQGFRKLYIKNTADSTSKKKKIVETVSKEVTEKESVDYSDQKGEKVSDENFEEWKERMLRGE